MSNKDELKLKGHLDRETYSQINFSQKEKERVLVNVTSAKKRRKSKMPLVKKLALNAAAAIVLVGMGTFVYQEVQKNQEAVVDQPENSDEEALARDEAEDGPKPDIDKDVPDTTADGSSGPTDDKAWEDRTITEKFSTPNDPKNANEFIAQNNEIYQQPLPEQYADDPMHYYGIGASSLYYWLETTYKVEGTAIEKDFRNLKNLAAIVVLEEKERYAHLGLVNENPYDYKDQWKEPSDRMEQAHEYLKDLLNEINVAINEDGKGETKGYSYMLDGEKVKELQEFIGTDEEIKAMEIIED
ncbi:hypothetical protein [Pseudalkalibacillus caeni]|uniref:Uncharacterized protein n=1 Tax=Exobacillus caeni TaxID=2574798 RepID=A0A5R9EVR1_9BACL|nr:hypothetical protein [Pseudalkalibacillus caeni]TLS35312.1 hypothetical protein FCL54_21240 [Pseudalkalibacillus caeni]